MKIAYCENEKDRWKKKKRPGGMKKIWVWKKLSTV